MADLIVVLERARVAEAGSHEELVARGGTYAGLYGVQAAAIVENALAPAAVIVALSPQALMGEIACSRNRREPEWASSFRARSTC